MEDINIRKADPEDHEAIWSIIQEVITTGDTYVFLPDTPRDQLLKYWVNSNHPTFIATIKDKIVGTFIIKDNQPGLGDHICNGSFMVRSAMQGYGIGKAMGKDALIRAKKMGYSAMQFNMVLKSNEPAISLWASLGFKIIGEIPEAFRHPKLGLTNAYIMIRGL